MFFDTSTLLAPLVPVTQNDHSSSGKSGHKLETAGLRFQDVGVWTVMREAKTNASWGLPHYSKWKLNSELLDVLSMTSQFLLECISVGPSLVIVYLLSTLWIGFGTAIGLYLSSRILDIVQHIIVDRQVDSQSLFLAVAWHITFTLVNCVIQRVGINSKNKLATRIRYKFEERLIQANLRLDFPTFEEPDKVEKLNKLLGKEGAWKIFKDLVYRIQGFASVASQIGFLFSVLSAHPGGGWFTALCVGKTLLDHLGTQNTWNEISYVWDSNPHYRRMSSLLSMITSADHRIEIVSNVLAGYIQREWVKAHKLLGDVSDDHPHTMFYLQRPIFFVFLDAISGDFPLIFYAFQVLRSPASFSLTSIALMQQASTSLGFTISNIVNADRSLRQRMNDMRALYEGSKISNKILDGELEYPSRNAKISAGMEITFDNVSFGYSQSDNVIKDVSFTIRRGQTVVIVGVNGSGKSTLLKLFNRLYDPTAGTVLVDGVPMQSFNCEDLRRASAMLFQTFTHYPLPIRENILLGLPDKQYEDTKDGARIKNDLVQEAARLGGSIGFIQDQATGFDTVLKPRVHGYTRSFREGSEIFRQKIKEIDKKVDVSSGQWQRLALSRLFHRATGEDVKLVAADEPSASLDPEMEFELFDSLRRLSTAKGKTLVFVTHRYGHLTKHADLILVMQKGRLIEQGKHGELVEMGGEYAKLYKLQAEAFLPSNETKT